MKEHLSLTYLSYCLFTRASALTTFGACHVCSANLLPSQGKMYLLRRGCWYRLDHISFSNATGL